MGTFTESTDHIFQTKIDKEMERLRESNQLLKEEKDAALKALSEKQQEASILLSEYEKLREKQFMTELKTARKEKRNA